MRHSLGNFRQAEMLRVFCFDQPIDTATGAFNYAGLMQAAQVFRMNVRRRQISHPENRLLPRQF